MSGNNKGERRRFGNVRKLPSGRYQARYLGPDGLMRPAPDTFETWDDADDWVALKKAEIRGGHWRDPDTGAVNFEKYALKWIEERPLGATTEELYRRLLRLHLLPKFGEYDLDEIAAPDVRAWRAERLRATGATTVAKSYRLLKAVFQTAFEEDELIDRNPCRIKGAGQESPKERPVATVAQVDALADAMGPRWRLMVQLAAYCSLRPEEQAELRREDVDQTRRALSITEASPELTTGRRVTGAPKSAAGSRTVFYPALLDADVALHMELYAAKGDDGLLFVGERGAPFRRSSFGRKWRKACAKVGMRRGFRFYDLRHTGNTLATQSGATLKDVMVRAGQSTEKAAMIYQHSTEDQQRRVAQQLDKRVRADRRGAEKPRANRAGTTGRRSKPKGAGQGSGSGEGPAPTGTSGTDLARGS
ncbi:tyrosine-type recombinase/integrase [Yinghuangia seranimata]|uniref:tyrosine-type recombinase/integrase n=1 Tax=Yinghuangia seranimata TaxID=408067 RepID=UPI00248C78F2|nr:tyrosine-type recombinase/integrase [Yinghuangia seranimata]MDI2130821.1 tyrosine-type recombinase/integrase [Yinghuangia seranimata]